MKLKIISRKDGSFTGNSGDEVQWFWYKAIRSSDNVKLEFGSREGGHEEDEEYDLDLEKVLRRNGTVGYNEVT